MRKFSLVACLAITVSGKLLIPVVCPAYLDQQFGGPAACGPIGKAP